MRRTKLRWSAERGSRTAPVTREFRRIYMLTLMRDSSMRNPFNLWMREYWDKGGARLQVDAKDVPPKPSGPTKPPSPRSSNEDRRT